MADDRMAVLDTVRKAIADGDVDFLREGVRAAASAPRSTPRSRPSAPGRSPSATATCGSTRPKSRCARQDG